MAQIYIFMPANRKLKPYLKSHVGRTFTLRKVVLVPTYVDAKSKNIGLVNSAKELGEAVLVLDESNTRVCVVKATGGTTWIPKYYLLNEVKSELYKKYDSLTEIINELCLVSVVLRGDNHYAATNLENTINKLRGVADMERKKVIGQ